MKNVIDENSRKKISEAVEKQKQSEVGMTKAVEKKGGGKTCLH